MDGGNGIDTVDYSSATSAVTVNLSTGSASGDGTDMLSNMENVTGSSHNDTLTGDGNANTLTGGDGNDTISGGGGNDILYGDGGTDTLTGGTGADTFVFKAATALSNVDTVTDFSTTDGDKLDLKDILTSFDPVHDAITDFVQITASGSDAVVKVDIDGTGTSHTWVQIATLTGDSALAGHEADLLANANLLAA